LPAKLGLTALPSSVAGPTPGDSMVSVSVIVSIIVRKRPARFDAGQGSQGIQRSSDGKKKHHQPIRCARDYDRSPKP
jgi:hypothetical protein